MSQIRTVVGFATFADGQLAVVTVPPGQPHECNVLCREGRHATLVYTDYDGELSIGDIQATADVAARGRSPWRVVAIERALEAPSRPGVPQHAWTVWLQREAAGGG